MKNRLMTSALCAALVAGAGVAMAQPPTFAQLGTPISIGAVITTNAPQDIVYIDGDAYVTTFGSLGNGALTASVQWPGTTGNPPILLRIDNVLTATPAVQSVVNPSHLRLTTPADHFGGPAKYIGNVGYMNASRGFTSIAVSPTGTLLVAGNPGGAPTTPTVGGFLREYDQAGFLVREYTAGASTRSFTSAEFFGSASILGHDVSSNFHDTTLDMTVDESVKLSAGVNFSRGVAMYSDGSFDYIFVRRNNSVAGASPLDSIRVFRAPVGSVGDLTSYTLDPSPFFLFPAASARASSGITLWTYNGTTYLVCIQNSGTNQIVGFDLTTTPIPNPLPAVPTITPAFTFATGSLELTGITFAEAGGSHYALVTRQTGTSPSAVDVYGVDGAALQGSAPANPSPIRPVDYANATVSEAFSQATIQATFGTSNFSGGANFEGMAMDIDTAGNAYLWESGSGQLQRLNTNGTSTFVTDAATLTTATGFATVNVTSIDFGRNALYVVVRDGTGTGVNSAVLRLPVSPAGPVNVTRSRQQPGIEIRYIDNDLIDAKLSANGTEIFIVQNDGLAGSDDNIYRIPVSGYTFPLANNDTPIPVPPPVAAPAPTLLSQGKFLADTGLASFNPSDIELDNEGTNYADAYVYDADSQSIYRVDFATPGEGTAVLYRDTATLASGGPVTPTALGITGISADFRGAVFAWDSAPSPNPNGTAAALVAVSPTGTVTRFQLRNTAGGAPIPLFPTQLGEPSGTDYQTRFSAMASLNYVNETELYVLDEVGQRILKVTFPEFVPPPVANGDADADTFIDVADVTAIYNFLGGITGSLAGDGDIDNDTDVDTTDADLLIDHLVNDTVLP